VADFLHIFNPSIVIFGGGVSLSGRLLLDPVYASMREHVIAQKYLDGLTLATAALGDEAGLMGALALARSLSAGR
jgi:glucokinase